MLGGGFSGTQYPINTAAPTFVPPPALDWSQQAVVPAEFFSLQFSGDLVQHVVAFVALIDKLYPDQLPDAERLHLAWNEIRSDRVLVPPLDWQLEKPDIVFEHERPVPWMETRSDLVLVAPLDWMLQNPEFLTQEERTISEEFRNVLVVVPFDWQPEQVLDTSRADIFPSELPLIFAPAPAAPVTQDWSSFPVVINEAQHAVIYHLWEPILDLETFIRASIVLGMASGALALLLDGANAGMHVESSASGLWIMSGTATVETADAAESLSDDTIADAIVGLSAAQITVSLESVATDIALSATEVSLEMAREEVSLALASATITARTEGKT